MQKLKIITICFAAVLFIFTSFVEVSAIELIGPKAFGMGGAFTAVADDTSSLYWNPAGLARSGMVGGELSMGMNVSSLEDFNQLVGSIEQGQLIKDTPLQSSVTTFIGANLKSYSGGVTRLDEISVSETGGYHYSQMIGNLALAHQLNRPFLNLGTTSFGVNFKLIQGERTEYQLTDKATYAGQGFALDLGMLFQVTDLVHIGASVKNLGPNLELIDGEAILIQPLQRRATLGAAVKMPLIGTTVAGDLEHDINANTQMAHLGFNQDFLFGLFSLRGGIYAPIDAIEDKTLTAGLGINLITFHGNVSVGSKDLFKEDLNGILSVSMKF